jgi:2-methylisocitrate lyase-like PEP mutase family enzyme
MKIRDVFDNHMLVIAPGAYDTISARIIEKAGFPIVYITGLGNEASDLGYPDLGLTTATELVRRASNITQCVQVPVVCDADTGFGGTLNLHRTIRMFEAIGVGAIHIEDQTFPKRCGVLAGKNVISADDFAKKIRAAVDSRRNQNFLIIARTDAKSSSDLQDVIRRLNLYIENGADMAMLGDFYTIDEYKRIVKEVQAPIVAIASCHDKFSLQPDISVSDWKKIGVKMVVYWHLPLFAAMKAVTMVVEELKSSGTTHQLKESVFSYSDYEQVVNLSKWLEIDKQFG